MTRESFCNRVKEIHELKKAVESSRKLFIFGERRVGKTSLLKKLISSLDADEFIPIYVDIWKCVSEDDFISACANAFVSAYETKTDKLLNFIGEFFSSIRPAISVDNDGRPVLVFGAVSKSSKSAVLEEVLSIPANIASIHPEKQVVVIFNEFPQIRSFETDKAERVLRSVIQHHEDVSYIFCGSRKHIIRDMFVNKSSPLYRSAAHYPIDYISIEHWIPFIEKNFRNSSKSISKECIEKIFSETQGHPFYTQMLCSVCFEITDEKMDDISQVDEALEILFERESHAFHNVWESFSINEKKLMLAIAKEKSVVSPYATEFIDRNALPVSSTLQRTMKKLLENDVIDQDSQGRYYIADKFFHLWILKKM
ncbi:MAG: AAA family ATPase [bacterium]